MRRFFQNLWYGLQRFMQGRYGYDELSRFLTNAALVLLLLSLIPFLRFLYFIAFVPIFWAWFRSFSKNICKRQMEREKYLNARRRIIQKYGLYRNMWRERKTHKYYRCSTCRAVVRISNPGKGRKIVVHCPKCNSSFEKRT